MEESGRIYDFAREAQRLSPLTAADGIPNELHEKGSHNKSFAQQRLAVSKGGAFVSQVDSLRELLAVGETPFPYDTSG